MRTTRLNHFRHHTSREMRTTIIAHAVVSFFFNTVILALAVNVVTRG